MYTEKSQRTKDKCYLLLSWSSLKVGENRNLVKTIINSTATTAYMKSFYCFLKFEVPNPALIYSQQFPTDWVQNQCFETACNSKLFHSCLQYQLWAHFSKALTVWLGNAANQSKGLTAAWSHLQTSCFLFDPCPNLFSLWSSKYLKMKGG